ncbi:MAG: HpcH/HpaI aldolase/citrate lyase family protein [Rhodospirillales bacterium]|jgi:citrate lyase subunit beta/citryl-CoA lyase
MSKPLITLYIPGTREDMILKSAKYEPDAIIIDLEDTVPMDLKAETRTRIADLIPQLSLQPIIRINNEPDLIQDDLKAVASDKINSILVPMAEDLDALKEADRVVTKIEIEQGYEPDSIKFILMMESVLGVMRCYDLATSVKRVESVAFGSAEDGDLQREMGCGFSVEGTEMLYARSKVLLEARAAKLPYVLDGAFSAVKDLDALRADCTLSRRLGYDGRTLIHPSQIPVAREAYSLPKEELAHYRKVVEEFGVAEANGLAAVQVNGKLIDYAMYKQAKAVLARSE